MFLERLHEVEPPPADPIVHHRRRRRKRIAWWAIAIVVAMAAAVTVYWFRDELHLTTLFTFHPNNAINVNTNVTTNRVIGTTPASLVDTDHDGLTDDLESLYGTETDNTDTDGDTFSDGKEVANGYDPLLVKEGARMVDLALVTTIAKGDANVIVVSSGMGTADRERYYLLYDGASTSYYAADGSIRAQCPVNTEPEGICATLPNEIRTDFSRTYIDTATSDAYHAPF